MSSLFDSWDFDDGYIMAVNSDDDYMQMGMYRVSTIAMD